MEVFGGPQSMCIHVFSPYLQRFQSNANQPIVLYPDSSKSIIMLGEHTASGAERSGHMPALTRVRNDPDDPHSADAKHQC